MSYTTRWIYHNRFKRYYIMVNRSTPRLASNQPLLLCQNWHRRQRWYKWDKCKCCGHKTVRARWLKIGGY